MIKGFTCGAMDLLHAGHVLMLKECREQCDYLIVGLQDDPSITDVSYRGKKKNKPIETLEERKIRLEGCKYVDQIIVYKTEEDLYELLKNLKPDVRFVGMDWKGKHVTGDNLIDIKIIYNSRGHNYSSSDLRRRIADAEKNKEE
ncbi:MAG: adenylyltransferase/cytidyltransferase family protein [Candidatus Paceibacterota bacterium]|jgi:glycerol-3-phosphate cytidylyltransferase